MKLIIYQHLALLSIVLVLDWMFLALCGCFSALFTLSDEFYCTTYCYFSIAFIVISVGFVVVRFAKKIHVLNNEKISEST